MSTYGYHNKLSQIELNLDNPSKFELYKVFGPYGMSEEPRYIHDDFGPPVVILSV